MLPAARMGSEVLGPEAISVCNPHEPSDARSSPQTNPTTQIPIPATVLQAIKNARPPARGFGRASA